MMVVTVWRAVVSDLVFFVVTSSVRTFVVFALVVVAMMFFVIILVSMKIPVWTLLTTTVSVLLVLHPVNF